MQMLFSSELGANTSRPDGTLGVVKGSSYDTRAADHSSLSS